jgi:putative sterol carrier protein
MNQLRASLDNFQSKANANDNVHKLVKDWSPNIIIETMDTDESYTLLVRDERIAEILENQANSSHEIRLEGDTDVLQAIFYGDRNPAEAVLNGDLAVFGNPNDQIKLDAITLLIWGM